MVNMSGDSYRSATFFANPTTFEILGRLGRTNRQTDHPPSPAADAPTGLAANPGAERANLPAGRYRTQIDLPDLIAGGMIAREENR
jgi:hypothetical protein